MLQKRAIRNINRAKYRAHTEPLFKSSLILKLTDLYEYQVTLFMFDYIANKLPISFHNTFKFNRDIENARITRQSDLLYVKRCRSQYASRLPLFSFPTIWNRLSISLNNSTSRSLFKYNLKMKLISVYPMHVKCINRMCRECFEVK